MKFSENVLFHVVVKIVKENVSRENVEKSEKKSKNLIVSRKKKVSNSREKRRFLSASSTLKIMKLTPAQINFPTNFLDDC